MNGKRAALVVGLGAVALALAGWSALHVGGAPLPSPQQVRARWQPSQAWLLDRDGVVLDAQRLDYGARRDAWTALEQFSPALRAAVVRAEDRRFMRHHGIDYVALGAAAWDYARGERRRGASTLSMQLAGMLDPAAGARAGRRDIAAKLRQLRGAARLEAHWSKPQILEAWLNMVTLRGELQGMPVAARALLGKHVSGLDERESLLLAALVSSPNAAADRLATRACRLATEPGSCAGLRDAALAAFSGNGAARSAPPQLAPQLAQRLLHVPGAQVRSTLSAPLQRTARDVLARQLLALESENLRDGALVVVDNASGDVLAYVASGGPRSTAANVDGARALRQAGSTLKPFLYALAFERRYLTPASLLDDAPLSLGTDSGLYVPQNYDRGFKGVVSARTALASSLNIPAVRTLMLTGVETFRERLLDFGYDAIREQGEFYGYSLALGSAKSRCCNRRTRIAPSPTAACGARCVSRPPTRARRRGACSTVPRRFSYRRRSRTARRAPSRSAWTARWARRSGPR